MQLCRNFQAGSHKTVQISKRLNRKCVTHRKHVILLTYLISETKIQKYALLSDIRASEMILQIIKYLQTLYDVILLSIDANKLFFREIFIIHHIFSCSNEKVEN